MQSYVLKSGDRIGFLGDSITEFGNDQDSGYINLVMDALNASGIDAVKVPAGISGNRAPDMLARLDRDIIAHNVQYMTLSCGVNDVWHKYYPVPNGVELPQYKHGITEIIDRAQKAGIKVIIMTATMITEEIEDEKNQDLIPYNEFLRQIAAEKECCLIDLNAIMQKIVAGNKAKYPNINPSTFVTVDGVHMNPYGNIMIATELLKIFGIDDKSIAACVEKWNDRNFNYCHIDMTVGQFRSFIEQANAHDLTINGYATKLIRAAVAGK